MRFAGDAMTGDYVSSAGTGGADIFSKTSEKAPNYGKLGITSMAEKSKERQQSFLSEGKVASAGMQTLGQTMEAQNNAKAGIAAAEAEASATRQNGMMSMFGDIAGAGISKFGNLGKWSDATDIGFAGNQVDKNGRLRY